MTTTTPCRQRRLRCARQAILAAAIAAINTTLVSTVQAALFKIDFGHFENDRPRTDANNEPILDANGEPIGPPPNLVDWTIIPTWLFEDPNGKVIEGSASAKGTANADGTEVTWTLIDSSSNPKKNVTLTIKDNRALVESLSPEDPKYMRGQTANNPTREGITVVYDGVNVPAIVKDDYLYREPDTAGSESLMRIANLDPGSYSVTVFEGRTTDGNRTGKIWVDDIKGANEPAAENTGSYSGQTSDGTKIYKGQPRTQIVNIKAGEYLWFAEMEDNSGGISGMIIRSIDPTDSPGLFKIDFGHRENELVPAGADGTPQLDPDGVEVGPPPVLTDWNVIPTWLFTDPNALVTAGSASVSGTANADGTEVTWKLTDFSKAGNKNVTMTILDNKALTESVTPEDPKYMKGMTVNNPTREGIAVMYDGVLVPAVVKDDYLYREPDTAGTESLMRFAGLTPGKYNVTVFEGRTTDAGRTGKVWVDDIKGAKEPTTENTGNYSGKAEDGTVLPFGQPRTVTVEIKAGEYLWFAEMEDNSGGISGMIIRGVGSAPVVTTVELLGANSVAGPYTKVADATVDTGAKSIKVAASGVARFFRVSGSSKITGSSVSGGSITITYQ